MPLLDIYTARQYGSKIFLDSKAAKVGFGPYTFGDGNWSSSYPAGFEAQIAECKVFVSRGW
jgi:hypothetical protein